MSEQTPFSHQDHEKPAKKLFFSRAVALAIFVLLNAITLVGISFWKNNAGPTEQNLEQAIIDPNIE